MIDLFAVVSLGGLVLFRETLHDFDWRALCNAALKEISRKDWSSGTGQLTFEKHSVHYLRTEEAVLIVSEWLLGVVVP